jgi:serine/threonine-protein kinase
MAELGVWTIPGYVVHERLQSGLVSAAYLASRTSDGYPVLLQVISEEFSDPLSAEHFRSTIEQVSAVRHPVIPAVSEIGEADGLLYTISSAVEGRSLDATLRSQGTLPMDDTLAVCRELADALDMLTSAGVVHGAVSPVTVWINDRVRSPSAPYVALRGFGTTPLRARRIQDRHATPPPDVAYTAPEQVRGSAPVERTDQYALACMVLHCLTGSVPFARETVDDLFDAHVAQEPDDAMLQADRLPGRVVTGLRRALSKDPADRFPTCTDFASAIGATARPSWTWMIEAGQAPGVPDEIDIRDEATGTVGAAGGRPASTSPSGSRTARSLSEVDWLPGSATRTGTQQPVRAPGTATAGRGPNPVTTPARPRRITTRHARWLGLALLAVVVTAGAVALGRTERTVDRTGTADQPTGDGVPEIAASWREPIADGPVDLLAAEADGVLSVSGAVVASLDHETGMAQWSTELDAPVSEMSVLGPAVILRTASQFVALDRADGTVMWRSSETGMPELDAFITGRGRMFGVARDDAGDVAVHAIDPTSGEIGWTITTPAPADGDDDAPAMIAFDGSEGGQRSLYVVEGDVLSAVSVTTHELRWQITLEGGHPVSMTALAGAVLTVSDDGEVCRYHADDGEAAWTTCATLERAGDAAGIAQVRDSSVIVAGRQEVLSVDFTSGTPRWRIVSEEALQGVIAANRAATYVAAPDGSVEAIAQRNGASLWESAPFGPISAMAASDDAVYLTTSDGRLTRLEAPAAPALDG